MIFLFIITLSICGSLYVFSRNYFILFPKLHSSSFQFALNRAIPFIEKTKDYFDEIIISNDNNLYQSYMFYLFQTKFDPVTYQRLGGTKSGGFASEHKIGNLSFRQIDWEKEKKGGKVLYVGNPEDFRDNQKGLQAFVNLNGEEAVIVRQE